MRPASVREHNLGVALRLVAEAPSPVSRAQIAARTGLTRATASTLVDALVQGRLVREVPLPPTSRSGRPAGGLVLAPGGPGGVGVEVHVDHVATTVVDLTGTVVFRRLVADDLRRRTPRAAMTRVARAVCVALDAAAEQGVAVHGVAVALPGIVDAERGRLLLAPNLGWRDVDVVGLLRREPRLGSLRLAIGNEADYAALGELASAGPDGPRSFLHVSGEVGIGAGIVLDGRLFTGTRGWGGEIGHVVVDPAGPSCGCGARGCLEQYAGQDAVLRSAGLAPLSSGTGSAGTVPSGAVPSGTVPPGAPGDGRAGGQQVVRLLQERAAAGDPAVTSALEAAARALGTVLAGVVNVLDLDTVVLGGTYAVLAPWLVPGVERELAGRVLWSGWAPTTVRTATAGVESAVRGAASAVVSQLLADPSDWLAANPS